MSDNSGAFKLPVSPFTPQQTEEIKRLKDMLPQIEQYIKDAKAIGNDTTEAEKVFQAAKEQLTRMVAVYGNKYG